MRLRTTDVFFAVLGLFLVTSIIWLALGLLPAVAAVVPPLHEFLHERGHAGGFAAELAGNAAGASHGAESVAQAILDYLFSVLNLALGALLIHLRPRDWSARLMALALVGTAVAFNLQGHDALQVLPAASLGVVTVWHDLVHVSSGLSYVYALLLFPAAKPAPRRGVLRYARFPGVLVLTYVFVALFAMTTDDHTFGLVVAFGIAVPVVGVVAQVLRYRRAESEDVRRQSRLLLWALGASFLLAVPLVTLTTSSGPQKTTVEYEVTIANPGTYFFRCDPHPDDMVGVAKVVGARSGGGPGMVTIGASDNEFDKSRLVLAAGHPTIIRFTNHDADLHNVAIYRSSAADEALFVGREFHGQNEAALAFRIFRMVFALIPVALFIALVRFRLWHVERVLNRALLYAVVAAVVTLAYLGVVVGIGTVLGAGRRLNIVLSLVVTVVAAAAFQPLRDRARRIANRLVYGKRATPYEVLTELSARLRGSYDVEEVMPRLARSVSEGTGAVRTEIWLRVGDKLLLSASWPGHDERRELALRDGDLPSFLGANRAVAVRHQGELLGAFVVVKRPGEAINEVEERLLEDVASQAALVLKNVQLTAELQARLEELRASRQRIVAAQDEERRRLERNIHDGAQQHLIGLSLKLKLAEDLAEKDPDQARRLLAELQADAGEALQTLRDLARGIYPPVLADRGLADALRAHARRCPVDVHVEAQDIPRLDRDVENLVYFCCLEAIQNAVKHGRPPVTVRLARGREELEFSVTDEGDGFDAKAVHRSGLQNVSDRLASLGGTLEIDSALGRGTTVRGRIPLRADLGANGDGATATPATTEISRT